MEHVDMVPAGVVGNNPLSQQNTGAQRPLTWFRRALSATTLSVNKTQVRRGR